MAVFRRTFRCRVPIRMKNNLKHRRKFVALTFSCWELFMQQLCVFRLRRVRFHCVISVSLGSAVLSVCVCLVCLCLCGSDKHERRCVNVKTSDNQAEPSSNEATFENAEAQANRKRVTKASTTKKTAHCPNRFC